jgi:hypothetical protein
LVPAADCAVGHRNCAFQQDGARGAAPALELISPVLLAVNSSSAL